MIKKMFQRGGWVLLGQSGTMISQMLIAILLARILTPDNYGVFQVILKLVLFSAVFATLGMGWGIVSAVADALAKGNNKLARLQIRSILFLVACCSIIVNFIYMVLNDNLVRVVIKIDLSNEEYLIMSLVFLTAMQQVLPEGFRGMHNFKLASLLSGSMANFLFLVIIFCIWCFFKVDLTVVLWGLTVSTTIVVIISYWSLKYKLGQLAPSIHDVAQPLNKLIRDNVKAGLSLTATNLVNFFVNQSDVWIVASLFSVTDAAYYAAASRVALLMSVPAMVASGTVRPTIVALWCKGETAKLEFLLRTISTVSVFLTIVPLAVISFSGGGVMEVLFGEFYRDGGRVLFIISLGWFSLLMFGPAGTFMMLVGRQRQYLHCTMVSGAVFLIAALTLPKYYSVDGVAVATALGMFVNSALAAIYTQRVMKVKTFCYLHVGYISK